MADGLEKTGNALAGIAKATKLAQSLGAANGKLRRIITDTNRQANVIENLNMPGLDGLVEMKIRIRDVLKSTVQLESFCSQLGKRGSEFNGMIKKLMDKKTIEDEDVKECANELETMFNMSQDFSLSFNAFLRSLEAVKKTADDLMHHLEAEDKKERDKARSAGKWGVVKSVGVAAIGTGAAVAICYFSGGTAAPVAAKVAAGAVAGATIALTAGSLGKTYVDYKELTDIADTFKSQSLEMKTVADELKYISEMRLGPQKLNDEMIRSLEFALNIYKRDVDQQRVIAKQAENLAQKDDEIAQKDDEIAQLKAQLEKLQSN